MLFKTTMGEDYKLQIIQILKFSSFKILNLIIFWVKIWPKGQSTADFEFTV